jgi:hypothetical protein
MSTTTETKSETHRCSEEIYSGFSAHQCHRKGVTLEGGKWWCKQHAPSLVKARRDARDSEWQAKRDAAYARQAREEALSSARALVVEAAKECKRSGFSLAPTIKLSAAIDHLEQLEQEQVKP